MSVSPSGVRAYVKRLAELAVAGFGVGVTTHITQHGFELTEASVRGLFIAGGLAAYGVVVKVLGDTDRPTAVR